MSPSEVECAGMWRRCLRERCSHYLIAYARIRQWLWLNCHPDLTRNFVKTDMDNCAAFKKDYSTWSSRLQVCASTYNKTFWRDWRGGRSETENTFFFSPANSTVLTEKSFIKTPGLWTNLSVLQYTIKNITCRLPPNLSKLLRGERLEIL